MTGVNIGGLWFPVDEPDEQPEDAEREEVLARIEEESDRRFDEQRDARWDKEHG